jgi:CRP/FNR family transcriptional regulator, cyclic AMP receptor protein
MVLTNASNACREGFAAPMSSETRTGQAKPVHAAFRCAIVLQPLQRIAEGTRSDAMRSKNARVSVNGAGGAGGRELPKASDDDREVQTFADERRGRLDERPGPSIALGRTSRKQVVGEPPGEGFVEPEVPLGRKARQQVEERLLFEVVLNRQRSAQRERDGDHCAVLRVDVRCLRDATLLSYGEGMTAIENKVWYLKKSRLFERVGDDAIGNCEHLFTQVPYSKRTLIFEQGDIGRLVYFVKIGRVRIARATEDGKEVTVAILGPGDLFGEEVVFSDVVRTTSATCLEDSLLCTARAEDLYGLMARHASIAMNVANYLREQRDDALSVVEDLASLKVPERLMKLLERLATEHGVRSADADGTLIDITLTHADLASLIGSTRETVTAQITQLTREGRIRTLGRRLIVPDRALAAAP